MMGRTEYRLGITAGLVLLLIASSPAWADNQLKVQPKVVEISSFFSGARMNITGNVPPGSQAVLRIRGKRIESELMRKTHRWELWINRGEVDIGNTPGLYIALSSDPRLFSSGAGAYPWGYDALEREADFSGVLKKPEDPVIFQEFVQLKERDQLYRLYPGGLKIIRTDPNQWKAKADFPLPSRIKPGTYRIALWCVRNGRVIERHDSSFEVRRKGLPKFLYSLAMKHGTVYGFLAVALAMVVGILTGFVFHRRGGGH